VHGIPALHHAIAGVAQGAGSIVGALWPLLADALVGVAAGAAVLAAVRVGQRLWRRTPA
jgi:predicted DNA repair protein MutK